MKISEKQLMMLMDILKDTLKISNVIGGCDLQLRLQLTNDLINQQSNELTEVEPKREISPPLDYVVPIPTDKKGKSILKG